MVKRIRTPRQEAEKVLDSMAMRAGEAALAWAILDLADAVRGKKGDGP